MTDIRLSLGDMTFALRAGILCVQGGRLLTIFGKNFDFGYVPGGAVGLGEDAAQAAAREWHEETGLEPGPLQLVGIVENFFVLNGRRWHEVGLYFRMDVDAALLPSGTALKDSQGGEWLEWVPLPDLPARRVYPRCLQGWLEESVGQIRHVVTHD